jgi:hypothetical protein
VAAQANTGVMIGGLAPEIGYGAAVSLAATGTVSIVGELLGRWIESSGHLVSTTAAHPLLNGVNTIRLTGDSSSLEIVTIVPGFKWNLADTWVLAGNVSIPLTSSGLNARFTRLSFRPRGVDLPVAAVFAEREVPDARLDARVAVADLRHVPRRALAHGGRRVARDAHVAGVEGQRLQFEAVERARERRLIHGRPHGLCRLRVQMLVGEAVAFQRVLNQGGLVDGEILEREPFAPRLRAVSVARDALRLSKRRRE